MKNHIENVSGSAAAEKIKELTKQARTCMMMTQLAARPIEVRPMAVQKVDEAGRLYFFTARDSAKVEQLEAHDEMQITISDDNASAYTSLYGHAEVYRNQEEINEMYTPLANVWFEGKEDPNLYLLRFTPEAGHYWDSKAGKLVQLLGFVVGAVTGKQTDNGRQGDIQP